MGEQESIRVIGLSVTDPIVKVWQHRLNVPVDGIINTRLDRATKRFQVANDLVPDGLVGPKTWAAAGGYEEHQTAIAEEEAEAEKEEVARKKRVSKRHAEHAKGQK